MVILNNKYIQRRIYNLTSQLQNIVDGRHVFIRGSYRTGVKYISDLDVGITTPANIKQSPVKYRQYIMKIIKAIKKQTENGEPWVLDEVKFMNIDNRPDHHISMNGQTDISRGYLEIERSTSKISSSKKMMDIMNMSDIMTIEELIDRSENISIYFYYPIDPKTHQYMKVDIQIYNTHFQLYDPKCDASIKRRDIDIIKALKRLSACIMYLITHQKTLKPKEKDILNKKVVKNREIVSRYDLIRSILEALDVCKYFYMHKYSLKNANNVTNSMLQMISRSIMLFIKQNSDDSPTGHRHPAIYSPSNETQKDNITTNANIYNIMEKYETWLSGVTKKLNKRYRMYYDKVYKEYLDIVMKSESYKIGNNILKTHKRRIDKKAKTVSSYRKTKKTRKT